MTATPVPPAAPARRALPPATVVALGLVGTVALAVSSYWTAAVPQWFRHRPTAVVAALPLQSPLARVGYFGGLALLVLAWLLLGHRMLTGPADDVDARARRARTAGLLWGLPLLAAVPLASRDLWAYAAQARVAAAGLNPYRVGPAAVPGDYLANVTPRWAAVPSPYGPLWTLLGRGLQAPAGDHVLAAVLLLRLPSAAGLALLAACVPDLARRLGGRPDLATWALVAGPLSLYAGLGGGHNDVLMVGLVALALWLLLRLPRPAPAVAAAGAVLGLAAAVKFPAVVVVPFLPLLAARHRADGPGPDRADATGPVTAWSLARLARRRGPAAVVAALPGVVTWLVVVLAASVAAGYGLDWVGQLSTSSHGGGPLGTVLLVLALVACWVLALRWPPLPMAAVAMLVVSLASSLSLAWYWLWPLAVAAPLLRRRPWVVAVAVLAVGQVLANRPNGQALVGSPALALGLGALLTWAVLDRRWNPFPDPVPDPVPVSAPPRSGTDGRARR